jgi:hypothetical protein
MAKTQIATRIDDTLKQRIDDYAERHDVTKAEAQRHLLARGVDYEEGKLAPPGTDDTEHDDTGDTLLMIQNLAGLASATAALTLALIISIIGVVGISPTWVTMMLTTAVASIAFGGVVTFTVAKVARASWASRLGVEVPGGADR